MRALTNKDGKVVVQLFTGEDGGGNLRMRSGRGIVRVKLGATDDGSGLVLMDKDVEPAIRMGLRRPVGAKGNRNWSSSRQRPHDKHLGLRETHTVQGLPAVSASA